MKDIESGKPMTRDAIFKMASSTKPVTGVAIMMLVEEGKMHLTDPVSRFIPEFKEMKVAVEKEGSAEIELVKAEREISIRDLLTHGSGLLSGGAGTKRRPGAAAAQSGGREPGSLHPSSGHDCTRLPAGYEMAVQRARRH